MFRLWTLKLIWCSYSYIFFFFFGATISKLVIQIDCNLSCDVTLFFCSLTSRSTYSVDTCVNACHESGCRSQVLWCLLLSTLILNQRRLQIALLSASLTDTIIVHWITSNVLMIFDVILIDCLGNGSSTFYQIYNLFT